MSAHEKHNENETIADIIAEMRNEGHTGPADALEWVREKMTYYADILEAAHKREVVALRTRVDMLRFGIEQYRQYHAGVVKKYESKICDTAKLREACANIAEYARSAQCHTEDAHVLGYLNQVEGWAKAALAAPARNCDKHATADEALKAQEQMFNDSNFANGECKLGCPECDNPRVGCKIAWLFAPAKEQEGGNNGR